MNALFRERRIIEPGLIGLTSDPKVPLVADGFHDPRKKAQNELDGASVSLVESVIPERFPVSHKQDYFRLNFLFPFKDRSRIFGFLPCFVVAQNEVLQGGDEQFEFVNGCLWIRNHAQNRGEKDGSRKAHREPDGIEEDSLRYAK